jgi:hypothetical protein
MRQNTCACGGKERSSIANGKPDNTKNQDHPSDIPSKFSYLAADDLLLFLDLLNLHTYLHCLSSIHSRPLLPSSTLQGSERS